MIKGGVLAAVRTLAYSSFIIGVGASAQTWLTYREAGIVANDGVVLMVGLLTTAVYTLQRAVRFRGQIPELVSERHHWMDRNRKVLLMSAVICGTAGIALAFVSFSWNWMLLLPFVLITLLYTMPLPGIGTKRYGLRELPYVKILLIAITWVAVTVGVPLIHANAGWQPLVWSIAVERGLFLLAITVPFDIRDVQHDNDARKTLPQVIGVQRSKLVALTMLFISFGMLLLRQPVELVLIIPMGVAYLIAAGLIRGTHMERHELYFTGALDSTLTLMPMLIVLCEHIL